jgi:transcriptional regulator with XRE-family HTH domain
VPAVLKTIHAPRYRTLLEMLVVERKAVGLTQVQMAKRLRKPQSYVSKAETGERRLDVLELIEYLRALGVDPLGFFRKLLR